MLNSNCFFFILFISLFLFTLLQIIHPSLRYAISPQQLARIEQVIIENFLDGRPMPIDDITFKDRIDFLGTVEFNLTQMNFRCFNLTDNDFEIHFDDPKKIYFSLSDVNAQLDFVYILRSNFYSNHGKGVVHFANMTIKMVNTLISVPNLNEPNKTSPGISIEELELNSTDLSFTFDNEGPLEKTIAYIIANLKDVIYDLIQQKFYTTYKPMFNEDIYKYIANSTLSFPLSNTTFNVSYSMNEEPTLSKEKGIEMSFEAQFVSENYTYNGRTYELPIINETSAMIDIIASQYLFDNYLYLMYKEGQLNTNITGENESMNLTVSILSMIFSNLSSFYNTSQIVDLSLTAFDSPIINLLENKANFTFKHNIGVNVRKEDNTTELAVAGDAILEGEANFFLTQGVIHFEFTSIQMTKFNTTYTKIGTISEDKVVQQTNLLLALSLSMINQQLQESIKGIQIPSIGNIQLNHTDVNVHEKYLTIGVNLYVNATNLIEPLSNIFY